ncbi:MAG: helix-turn-helix domain-containing protein [archaeon]
MWVAKLKINHKDCPIVSRAKKFNSNVLSHPGKYSQENGQSKVRMECKFLGNESARNAYYSDLKNDPKVLSFNSENDYFVYEYNLGQEGEMTSKYFTSDLSYTKPTFNSADNNEYWEVSSFTKESLKRFYDSLTAHMDKVDLLQLSRKDSSANLFCGSPIDLSGQQRIAFELALKYGYYNFPRHVNLEFLASQMGISIATLQEHLRKAEAKIFSSAVLF